MEYRLVNKIMEDIFTPASQDDVKNRMATKKQVEYKVHLKTDEVRKHLKNIFKGRYQVTKTSNDTYDVVSVWDANYETNYLYQIIFFLDGSEILFEYDNNLVLYSAGFNIDNSNLLVLIEKELLGLMHKYSSIKEDIFTPISQKDLDKRKEVRDKEFNTKIKITKGVCSRIQEELSKLDILSVLYTHSSGVCSLNVITSMSTRKIYISVFLNQIVIAYTFPERKNNAIYVGDAAVAIENIQDIDRVIVEVKRIINLQNTKVNEDIFTPISQEDLKKRQELKDAEIDKIIGDIKDSGYRNILKYLKDNLPKDIRWKQYDMGFLEGLFILSKDKVFVWLQKGVESDIFITTGNDDVYSIETKEEALEAIKKLFNLNESIRTIIHPKAPTVGELNIKQDRDVKRREDLLKKKVKKLNKKT